jgi:hypothetical protein
VHPHRVENAAGGPERADHRERNGSFPQRFRRISGFPEAHKSGGAIGGVTASMRNTVKKDEMRHAFNGIGVIAITKD